LDRQGLGGGANRILRWEIKAETTLRLMEQRRRRRPCALCRLDDYLSATAWNAMLRCGKRHQSGRVSCCSWR
jgi:hypothetical protein